MRGKHWHFGIGLLADAAASAAARTPEAAGAPDTRARVDAIFRDLDRSDSPGCALGVYRDGKIVYAHG